VDKLKSLSLLISGQLFTSRTETLEDFFKDRVSSLGIIGITSPYASPGSARRRYYENGRLIYEGKIRNIYFSSRKWYSDFLLVLVFGVYFFEILKAAYSFKKKFDIFIGVACFSTLLGLILRRLGLVDKIIYYSIDYYPIPRKLSFNTVIVKAFRIIDKFCARKVDLIWHISPRIPEARDKFSKLKPNCYKHIVVPLTYTKRLLRFKSLEEIERYTIGFVGTLSENQGLQLLIRAMPEIAKRIPQIKVKIIGKGPYKETLEKLVRRYGVERYFEFYGFIKEEEDVLEILSHCTVGIAVWTSKEDDNILYADPGKPKLYAFCGLPIIITTGAIIAEEIVEREAGVSINYESQELINAIVRILNDDELIKRYKKNAFALAKSYTTENVFVRIMDDSLKILFN